MKSKRDYYLQQEYQRAKRFDEWLRSRPAWMGRACAGCGLRLDKSAVCDQDRWFCRHCYYLAHPDER